MHAVHNAACQHYVSSAAAFGQPVEEVFSSLSALPVASASLGQVYKGRLRDTFGGGDVAVKVQRPAVLASVALDLMLMRRFAEFCQTFPRVLHFAHGAAQSCALNASCRHCLALLRVLACAAVQQLTVHAS